MNADHGMLPRRALGSSGLEVSELGLGCSSYWANPRFPERQALSLVGRALDGGITYFDTGPSYAAGLAERRLGAALRSSGGLPLVISTKAGTYVTSEGRAYRDWSPRGVREGLARSLDRLGRERIDLLLLHGPHACDLTDDLYAALSVMRSEGLAHAIGVNSTDPSVVRKALETSFFDAFMLDYNVLNKNIAPLIAEMARSGKGVIAATPIAQALFRPPWHLLPVSAKRAWELSRAIKNHHRDFRAARRYRFLNHISDMTSSQAALAYVLRNNGVATAVFGTTSPRHLEQNLQAASKLLPSNVLARIEATRDAGPIM